MALESEESDFQLITDDPEPDFCAVVAKSAEPRLVEADEDVIMYEVTINLPDAKLSLNVVPPNAPASPAPSFSSGMSDIITTPFERQDPPQSCRSVMGHQQPLHDLANETVELLTDTATTKPIPPRIPIANFTRVQAP